MIKTKHYSFEDKADFIDDVIQTFFRGGDYYDFLPETLKDTLDKQAGELYEIYGHGIKSFDTVVNKLQKIIYEQHSVYSTVDYFWMEDETKWKGCYEFQVLTYETFRLCGNINDKQDLSKIYAHLGLWETDSKTSPRGQEPLLKSLRKQMETLAGTEWCQLIKENKVFELLEYQNNKDRNKPVYDTVKKVLMAAFPAMKQFGETEWSIYNAMFEEANRDFRIKLFLLELKLDCGITSHMFDGTADNIIEKFLKLPKSKRAAINKLAERRMMGEKI